MTGVPTTAQWLEHYQRSMRGWAQLDEHQADLEALDRRVTDLEHRPAPLTSRSLSIVVGWTAGLVSVIVGLITVALHITIH